MQADQLVDQPFEPPPTPALELVGDIALFLEEHPPRLNLGLDQRDRVAARPKLRSQLRQLCSAALDCQKNAHRIEPEFAHPPQFVRQARSLSGKHDVDHGGETIILRARTDGFKRSGIGAARAFGAGIEIERQLGDF